MTATEVVLAVALALACLVAVALAYRATRFEGMLLKTGLLLGATALEYSVNGNVIVSDETLERFVDDHTLHVYDLPTGGVLVSALRVPKKETS